MMMMMVTRVFGLSRQLAVSHLLCSNSAKLQWLVCNLCVAERGPDIAVVLTHRETHIYD